MFRIYVNYFINTFKIYNNKMVYFYLKFKVKINMIPFTCNLPLMMSLYFRINRHFENSLCFPNIYFNVIFIPLV